MLELTELVSRMRTDLIARPEGPYEFRLLLQPLVAALLALRDDVVIDAVYQFKVNGTVFPGEALGIALLLGFVPYLLIRGPVDRIARRRRGGHHGEADQTQHSRHLG